MKKTKLPISKILVCLPKPQWAPAGIIWSISGALLQAGYDVDEFQYYHVAVPELFNQTPYLFLVSTELLDLNDFMHGDRSILLRAAQAFPQSIFIIWDKKKIFEPTDSPNPTNLFVWTNSETDAVTKRILKLLGVHDDGQPDRRRGRS